MSESGEPKDDLARLLKELYAQADLLPEADWRTLYLREFHELCGPKAQTLPDWESRLDTVKSRVNRSWENYQNLKVADRERTAETVAGHRLLVEGLAGWLEAVELCRQSEFEAAREAAIEANRLLILVQKQSRRLSAPTTPIPRPSAI